MLLKILLRQILRERVCIREIANELLLIVFDILQVHFHYFLYDLLNILIVLIDGLINLAALPITVYVSS